MWKFRLIYKIGLIVALTQFVQDCKMIETQADEIPIGIVFDKNTEEIQNVFKFAMVQLSSHPNRAKFQVYVDVISTADPFKLSRLICKQYSRGVIAMLGSVSPDSFNTFHSYTNTFRIPFITPWHRKQLTKPVTDFALSMRPDYHMAVIETIAYYGWQHIIYIYDSHDGLLRLQQLYHSFPPGKPAFRITHVKQVTNATEVVSFLLSIEKLNRFSNKYVVLDSTTEIAKETIMLHVKNVHLGRRNYHYLFSGLVLDDHWPNEESTFMAINITGFRVLDYSRKIVRDFFNASQKNAISAQAALMYDSILVLFKAIHDILMKKPDLIRRYIEGNDNRILDCNPLNNITQYELGEKIFKMIRKTEVEGLTGNLMFNKAGRRKNFSLQIMELTVKGTIDKVATWHENTGLAPIIPKTRKPNDIIGLYDREKTYVITTLLEAPYVIKYIPRESNIITTATFEGFCIDLAKLLMEMMEMKLRWKIVIDIKKKDYVMEFTGILLLDEIRIVRDGKYGKTNAAEDGGWDGIMGELIRQEADLAIAPIINTAEREAVVDFTIPFLSFLKKPMSFGKHKLTIFTFMEPLSNEIWFCIIVCLFGASMVLYLVSRFSPSERGISNEHQVSGNAVSQNPTNVNGLSYWNILWFTVSSLLQQGSYFTPRSMSGRIVTGAWWFFTFVFVSLYVCTLSLHITLMHMMEPIASYAKIATCPEDSPQDLIYDQNYDESCEMYVTIMKEGIQNFAVALPKESKLKAGIDLALKALLNDGSLQNIIRKWFTINHRTSINQDDSFSLSLDDTKGLFLILTVCLVTALSLTFVEHVYCKIYKSYRDIVPPTEDTNFQISLSDPTCNTTL